MSMFDAHPGRECEFGPIETAPFTGNPHRKCTLEGCRVVSLDLYDDRPYAEPRPEDVPGYVEAEAAQTDEQFRKDGHVTVPCGNCGAPIRAMGRNPEHGWFHDGGEESCDEEDEE